MQENREDFRTTANHQKPTHLPARLARLRLRPSHQRRRRKHGLPPSNRSTFFSSNETMYPYSLITAGCCTPKPSTYGEGAGTNPSASICFRISSVSPVYFFSSMVFGPSLLSTLKARLARWSYAQSKFFMLPLISFSGVTTKAGFGVLCLIPVCARDSPKVRIVSSERYLISFRNTAVCNDCFSDAFFERLGCNCCFHLYCF